MAASPVKLHDELYGLFKRDTSGRILFRVDTDAGGPTVLLQSGSEPDWANLHLDSRDLRSKPESKGLELSPSVGTELTFRLLARPTRVSSTGKGNPRGPRRDLRTDDERLEWLHRKAELSGFRVTMCGLTMYTFPAVKSSVGYRAKGGTFSAVRFDGQLIVVDPVLLRTAVENGVGTQKAFGFGLLSLGR